MTGAGSTGPPKHDWWLLLHCFMIIFTHSWTPCTPIMIGYASNIMHHIIGIKLPRKGLWSIPSTSVEWYDLSSIKHLWDMAKISIHTHKILHLAVDSYWAWCSISKDIFWLLVESIAHQIAALWQAREDPTWYCVFIYICVCFCLLLYWPIFVN